MLSVSEFNIRFKSLYNELDIIEEKKKEIESRIRHLSEMWECPICYRIFSPNEMNGDICKGCADNLLKETFLPVDPR